MTDRNALTTALSQEWDSLTSLVADLDENHWRTPSPLPGWTVFDVLAHLVGIESILLGEPNPTAAAVITDAPHVHNEIGALNEAWIDSLRPLSGQQLLAKFTEVTDRRRKALAELTDEQWNNPSQSPVGVVRYGRFMQVRLFDCWMHELDIADALGVAVPEDGPRAEIAFDELTPTLGRAVVKGAHAPDGSRISVVLTGPVTRELHLVVEGRANQVDELDGPATVRIELPSGLFARLRAGRTTAAEHSDEITITGDTDLGRRVVDTLRFTI
ncbi:maleylpyruvate isomerase family mycothiol-dependent enzyme [Nocardia jiangxiensis]|uniref:Maleylpyruvate isomerase family mycothiol-dependent enzyme n=1 Tax=Nocardia jiangxiensis TaxID=282685 RepID=A0ABW6RZB3_9NOCA|nr:maleylpyruvate isomerase family mycothiol-dependent enzyme [Nocardia jiangxiensis]